MSMRKLIWLHDTKQRCSNEGYYQRQRQKFYNDKNVMSSGRHSNYEWVLT